jgi:hypothetical protein
VHQVERQVFGHLFRLRYVLMGHGVNLKFSATVANRFLAGGLLVAKAAGCAAVQTLGEFKPASLLAKASGLRGIPALSQAVRLIPLFTPAGMGQ